MWGLFNVKEHKIQGGVSFLHFSLNPIISQIQTKLPILKKTSEISVEGQMSKVVIFMICIIYTYWYKNFDPPKNQKNMLQQGHFFLKVKCTNFL